MEINNIFDYTFTCNNIPVRIIDDTCSISYHNESKDRLLQIEETDSVFTDFISKAKDEPELVCFNDAELIAFFRNGQKDREMTFIAGPVFAISPYTVKSDNKGLFCSALYKPEYLKSEILLQPLVALEEFVSFVVFSLQILQHKRYDADVLMNKLNHVSLHSFINKTISDKVFDVREGRKIPFHDYEMEQRYLQWIKQGDVDKLKKMHSLEDIPTKTELSDNPVSQRLYEMIALITLATRAAISQGVDKDTAYTISDMCIKQMDKAKNAKAVSYIAQSGAIDLANRVKSLKKEPLKNYSKTVIAVIGYIKRNLHEKISLKDLCNETGRSEKYISHLFKKETGVTLTSYVQSERINEAKNLLEYSDFSTGEISNYLTFSSQSYFIKIFKKHTGMTPDRFKKERK